MKALFLCESPLQIINAIEAKEHFKISDSDANIVILRGASRKNFHQQIELVNRLKWGSITYLNYRFRGVLVPVLITQINNLVKKNFGIGFVFVGDYRSMVMRHAVNKIKPSNVVLLDDGNATIHLARDRSVVSKETGIVSTIKKFIQFNILRIDDSYLEKVIYFTIYKIAPNGPDTVERNQYNYLKKSIQAKPQNNDVILLGSPFVETKVVSNNFPEKLYLKYLDEIGSDIRERFNITNIIYVAHRRENRKKLERINRLESFSVVDFNEPIELAMIKRDQKPFAIAAFYSAAVDTLITMYKNDVKVISYRLPETCIDSNRRSTVDGYYDYYYSAYDNETIQVVNLH